MSCMLTTTAKRWSGLVLSPAVWLVVSIVNNSFSFVEQRRGSMWWSSSFRPSFFDRGEPSLPKTITYRILLILLLFITIDRSLVRSEVGSQRVGWVLYHNSLPSKDIRRFLAEREKRSTTKNICCYEPSYSQPASHPPSKSWIFVKVCLYLRVR